MTNRKYIRIAITYEMQNRFSEAKRKAENETLTTLSDSAFAKMLIVRQLTR